MDPNTQQPDPKIAAIVKALALTENGGKIPTETKAGQSGEMKSIFQYTPGTWKMYSSQILGKEVPLDKGSETIVTYGKVHQMYNEFLQQGANPNDAADMVASVWNSGKPDAYLQDHKGTNKYGVQYDTPGYVAKFKKYLSQAEQGSGQKDGQSITSAPAQAPQIATQSAKPMPLAVVANSNTLPAMMQRNMKQVRSV